MFRRLLCFLGVLLLGATAYAQQSIRIGDFTLNSTSFINAAAWDPATVTNVTLSNSNLTASNTATSSADQGAHVPSAAGKSAGKYYYECVLTTLGTGANLSCGVGTTSSTYTGMGNTGTTGLVVYPRFGSKIFSNGSDTGKIIDTLVQGDVIAIAIDLDNGKGYFKKVGGVVNWNGTIGADPATNTGGLTIPAGTKVPFVTFGGTSGAANNAVTGNFGGSAFSLSPIPVGYTAGWPASWLLERDLNPAANDNSPVFLQRVA